MIDTSISSRLIRNIISDIKSLQEWELDVLIKKNNFSMFKIAFILIFFGFWIEYKLEVIVSTINNKYVKYIRIHLIKVLVIQ